MDRLELEDAETFESNAAPRCHSPAEPWPMEQRDHQVISVRSEPRGFPADGDRPV